jgi:TfoX/Sxy family transcriptional regulator of competence genes
LTPARPHRILTRPEKLEVRPMQVPRPTDADKERFRAIVPDDPRVEVRPMFGNLGAFVNGNMFMGLFGSAIGLSLPADRAEALRAAGGGPFGPAERPMGGWVTIPTEMVGTREVDRWLADALAHAAAKPPKSRSR